MADTIKGDHNLLAGRDLIIGQRAEARAQPEIAELFRATDRLFREVSESGTIYRQNTAIEFSSEALFSSLIMIGIPVSIAIDVPRQVIPLLKNLCEHSEGEFLLTTNHLKATVLQILTGLQFQRPSTTEEEVTTWCSAYVRRYGSGTEFLHVIDNGVEVDLNYEYIKETLLPHVLERVLGLEKGIDSIDRFHPFFSTSVLQRMAKEILRNVNTLNLYSIHYKTLYHLVREIMIQPPHPWIVNEATIEKVLAYNVERATFHYNSISKETATIHPVLFLPAARECAVHLCASILSYYGCLLGVESRYGLNELMRVITLKLKQRNLPMWHYCTLNNLERDLERIGTSLSRFYSFLERVQSSLYYQSNDLDGFSRAKDNCQLLMQITGRIIGRQLGPEDNIPTNVGM
jgi:hypothetical protein